MKKAFITGVTGYDRVLPKSVQYVVQEAVASGIEQILFVPGRNKRAIEDYFDTSFEFEPLLSEKGKDSQLAEIRELADMVDIHYVRQKQALGLGHAILCAKDFIGHEPFAVLLVDDIIDSPRPCLAQLLDVHKKYGGSVLGLEEVPIENISSYGYEQARQISEKIFEVTDLAIIGRYILAPEIFPILEQQARGKGGEIKLTDAILSLSKQEAIYGCRFEGIRHDCGDKMGFLKATVDLALKREEFNREFRTHLHQRLVQ